MPKLGGSKFISNSMGAFGLPAESDAAQTSDGLAVGFETMDRMEAISAVLTGSGTIVLSYFTAPYADVTTQVRTCTAGTAAATTTLARIGLYVVDTVAGNNLVSLAAVTANDTNLWNSATAQFIKSWTTPFTFTPGARYAAAFLFVGTTAPTLSGCQPGAGMAPELAISPRLSAQVTGQTDLPGAGGAALPFTIGPSPTNDSGRYVYAAFA